MSSPEELPPAAAPAHPRPAGPLSAGPPPAALLELAGDRRGLAEQEPADPPRIL